MDFRIHSPATRPLHGNRPRQTAPLHAAPDTPRETRRLGAGEGLRRPTGDLTQSADFRALQARGALTPEVLAQLKTLATQPLAEGIDRRTLIATLLSELADPERIAQGDRHTCAAAVVQAKLAQDDPAEYLRVVAGLASPAGRVTLANGDVLRRHADWRVAGGRSLSSDLLQPAFMQYATGTYDVRSDTRATANGRGKGLYAAEQSRLLSAVSGTASVSVFGNGPQVLDAMQRALDQGHDVPVVIKIRDRDTGQLQGHSVLVEAIRDGQVTFLDPNGKRRSVSLEAFTSRLQSASLPAGLVPPSLLKASEGEQGVLAGNPFVDFFANGAKAVGQALEEHVARPAVQAVTTAVQAVNEHVVQPVANAIGQAGAFVQEQIVRPVQENVLDPVAKAIGPVTDWLSTNVFQPLYVHVLEPLAVNVLWPVWEFVGDNARKAKEELEKHQEMLKNIAMIACLVTPGLNALALAIAVSEAIEGGRELLDGLKQGDWKQALTGTAKLFGGLATAVGGPILSKVVGSGAQAMARLLTGVSKLASAGAALADVCNERLDPATRFGKLLSTVVLGVGGTASVLGEQAEKAATGFTEVAQKANAYYDRSITTYRLLMDGKADWRSGLSQVIGLAADVHQDLSDDPASKRLRNQFREGAHVLTEAPKVWEALTRPDAPADVDSVVGFVNLGTRLHRDVLNDWNPEADEVGKAERQRMDHAAALWRESKGLQKGEPLDQVQAAWSYLKKVGASKSDDQLTQWLRGWTTDLESWGEGQGQAAKEWAAGQIRDAWQWWTEQRQAAAPS